MDKDEYVDIVDEHDNVIGRETEYNANFMPHKMTRSVAIFLFNSEGELFLQKRAQKKYRFPGYWCCSVGGVVGSGEDYAYTAARELKEELGVKEDKKLKPVMKTIVVADKKEQTTLFSIVYDGPIKINKDEIEVGKFFSIDEIKKMISEGEMITPYFLRLFYGYMNLNSR